jgi:hypothetical protein
MDDNKKTPKDDETDDADRPAGELSESHDEISPHDLPIDHPGRKATEHAAGGEEGTTKGNQ